MKKAILSLLFILSLALSHAQTTVYRKIAQRHDEFIASNWQGKDSILFYYNNDGILTNQTALKGNASNGWDNSYRNSYYLSPSGKVEVLLRENWDGSSWINNNKYTYTYDASDRNTLILYEVWSNNAWVPSGKIDYSGFNTFGSWGQQVTSTYISNAWNLSYKITRQFIPTTDKVEFKDSETWDNINVLWQKTERLYYTYFQDSIGTMTRSVSNANNAWVSSEKYLYAYIGTPLQIQSYTKQVWNTDSLNFLNHSHVFYAYNANNKLTQTLNEDYMSVSNWLPKQRTTFQYDANYDLIEKYTEDNVGGWTNTNRYMYTLNNGLVSEELYYIGNANVWNLSTKTVYNYNVNENIIFKQLDNYNGAVYTPYSRDFYWYHTFAVGLNYLDLDIENILIYPNPSNKYLSIQFHSEEHRQLQFSLIDMLGRTRYSTTENTNKGNYATHIHVEHIPTGSYFLMILDTKTGKKQIAKIEIVH